MKRFFLFAVCAACSVVFAGCDEELSSITGPTPNLEPTLSSIQTNIFNMTDSSGRLACIGCHTRSGPHPAGPGLVLLEGRSYQQLVGRASAGRPGATLVIPGDPQNSYLDQKTRRPGYQRRAHAAGYRTIPDRRPDPRHPYMDSGRRARIIEVTVNSRLFHASVTLALLLAVVAPAVAQTQDDPDLDINFAQPDFTLVNLPTTLRVPKFKSAFRVTHRFTRPLGDGDFGDLAEDLFGLDSGAQIGLDTALV